MSTTISGVSSSIDPRLLQRLQKIDSDGDGQITKAEFTAGRPDGVSESASASFFAKLTGSSSTESVSLTDLASAFQQLAPQTQGAAIRAQALREPLQSPEDMFSSLDTDGDGSLTKAEFLAGRPQGMSEEDAGALFDDLSGGSDSLTQEQFVAAAPPPPGGPRPPMGATDGLSGFDDDEDEDSNVSALVSAARTSVASSTEDLKALLERLLATLNEKTAAATTATTTTTTTTTEDAA